MGFIDKESFPKFPDFLEDIPEEDAPEKDATVTYDTTARLRHHAGQPAARRPNGPDPVLPTHTIDGELFNKKSSQSMVLNSVEEWTVVNKAVGIAHPFHIHINPFQVVEVFDPNSAEASDKNDRSATPTPETRDLEAGDLETLQCASGAVRLVGRPGNTCGPQQERWTVPQD